MFGRLIMGSRMAAFGAVGVAALVVVSLVAAGVFVPRGSGAPETSSRPSGLAAIGAGATPSPEQSSTPTATPSIVPTPSVVVTASRAATPSASPSVPPAPTPTHAPTATKTARPDRGLPRTTYESATVTGSDADLDLRWTFVEPVITTPTPAASAKINADVRRVLDGHLAYLRKWVASLTPEERAKGTGLTSSFTVSANASSWTDHTRGFITVQLFYEPLDAPWLADGGPQWVDVMNYDWTTGDRIPITAIFTSTEKALRLFSAAAANDPAIAKWRVAGSPTGYEPIASNFSIWCPTPNGIEIVFAEGQVGPAAAGTPRITVQWSTLLPLVGDDTYLDWYTGGH